MERFGRALPGYSSAGLGEARLRHQCSCHILALPRIESCDRFWDVITFPAAKHLFFETQETYFALASSIHIRPLAG